MIETALFGSPDGTGTCWRLMGVADDPATSWHYVRFKFDIVGGQLQGALVRRDTGEEIPLADLQFDGTSLSLRLPVAPDRGGKSATLPRLLLTLAEGGEFRGYYVDEAGTRLDPAHHLKLVRVEGD